MSLNSTKKSAHLHSGIFWACAQGCLAFGGIFLTIVFKLGGSEKINDTMIHTLYGVFTTLTVAGIILLIFLRMPPKQLETDKEEKLSQLELLSKLKSKFHT